MEFSTYKDNKWIQSYKPILVDEGTLQFLE